MNIDNYSFLIGILISIFMQYIAFLYNAKNYKKQRFLSIWLLGTALIILGYLFGFLTKYPQIEIYAIMLCNLFMITGSIFYYFSLKKFFNPDYKGKDLNLIFIIPSVLIIYLSVFSLNTILRMTSFSIFTIGLSILILRLLYKNRKPEIYRSTSFLINTYLFNIFFWVFRFVFIQFFPPTNPNYYFFIVTITNITALTPSILGGVGIIMLLNQKLTSMIEKENIKFFTIFEASPDPILVTEFKDGRIIQANKKFLSFTGYDKGEIIGKTSSEINFWSNELSRDKFIKQFKKTSHLDDFQDYFYTKDMKLFLGSVSSSKMILDSQEYLVCVIRDITEIKKAETKILESEQKYKAIALSSASWEAWYDEHGWLIWTNDMVEEITEYKVDETFEINDIMKHIIVRDGDDDLTKKFVSRLSKEQSGKKEFKINHKTSGIRWVLVSWRPVYDSKNIFKGIRTSIIDITRQKKSELASADLASQLRKEKEIAEKNSLTDPLTGLANRRYLEDRINYEFSRMKRFSLDLSIIMMDVDFFKQYNDSFGHIEGDECLKLIANHLAKSVQRGTDLVARYGGEEFVILLPDTSNQAAMKIANKIKDEISSLEILHPSSDVADVVTLSMGVATFNGSTKASTNDLIKEADKALYHAKKSGRNLVISA